MILNRRQKILIGVAVVVVSIAGVVMYYLFSPGEPPPLVTVIAEVKDARTKVLLDSVKVYDQGGSLSPVPIAKINKRGNIDIETMRRWDVSLMFEKDGYMSVPQKVNIRAQLERPEDIVVALTPNPIDTMIVNVVVQDGAGQPLNGVEVYDREESLPRSLVTVNGRGRVLIKTRNRETVPLRFSKPGYNPEDVGVIVQPQPKEITVVMRSSPILPTTLIVRDHRDGLVPGIAVYQGRRKLGETGREGKLKGRLVVKVTGGITIKPYGCDDIPQTITTPGQTLEIKLPPTVQFDVQVRDTRNQPITTRVNVDGRSIRVSNGAFRGPVCLQRKNTYAITLPNVPQANIHNIQQSWQNDVYTVRIIIKTNIELTIVTRTESGRPYPNVYITYDIEGRDPESGQTDTSGRLRFRFAHPVSGTIRASLIDLGWSHDIRDVKVDGQRTVTFDTCPDPGDRPLSLAIRAADTQAPLFADIYYQRDGSETQELLASGVSDVQQSLPVGGYTIRVVPQDRKRYAPKTEHIRVNSYEPSPSPYPIVVAPNRLEQGKEFLRQGNLQPAIDQFELIPPTSDQYVDGMFLCGLAYTRLSMEQQAIDCYTRVIRRDKDYAPAYFNRGILLFEERQWNRARRDFEAVITNPNRLGPETRESALSESRYRRARCYRELNQSQQACAALNDFFLHDPDPSLIPDAQALQSELSCD